MEVKRGDVVDTYWFKDARVTNKMYPYLFVEFDKPVVVNNFYFVHKMWIHIETVICLYRKNNRNAVL